MFFWKMVKNLKNIFSIYKESVFVYIIFCVTIYIDKLGIDKIGIYIYIFVAKKNIRSLNIWIANFSYFRNNSYYKSYFSIIKIGYSQVIVPFSDFNKLGVMKLNSNIWLSVFWSHFWNTLDIFLKHSGSWRFSRV